MASRDVAALDSGDLKGNHLIAQKSHDPANGANEARTGFASRPVHGLGPLEGEDGGGQRLGEDVYREAARGGLVQFVVVAGLLYLTGIDALFFGEAQRGLFAGGDGRTFYNLGAIGSAIGQVRSFDDQPAWSRIYSRGCAQEVQFA